jgi:hypothetical protein
LLNPKVTVSKVYAVGAFMLLFEMRKLIKYPMAPETMELPSNTNAMVNAWYGS